MNTQKMQNLKMAWLAAKDAGDIQAQKHLFQDYQTEQEDLVDFIAAYHALGQTDAEPDVPLLALTQRACQNALGRVFGSQMQSQPAFVTLSAFRKSHQLSKLEAAKGLQLSVDVWNKFEEGAIELISLSQRQLQRLAQFFQISIEQFSALLNASQPSLTLNRRQTRAAADQAQGPCKQTFADAIKRSTMSKEEMKSWLELVD